MSRLFLLCAALLFAGCPRPLPPPQPTPEPPPLPSPICQPGETCGCWVQPPGEDWQKLPDCTPEEPTPTPGQCPWSLAAYPGASLGSNTKVYGQGLDHTTLVKGSVKYCADRGWTDGRSVCAVAPDGHPFRSICEIELAGGCPIWQYRAGGLTAQCRDDQGALMSCDHFGSVEKRDDPKTADVFEGTPPECALQRGPFGYEAGFFVIAHGRGEVRSCVDKTMSEAGCGPWIGVDH
jgi:hypothetical protein